MKEVKDVTQYRQMRNKLKEDMHVDSYSVPGGWIYIVSVRRTDGDECYTSCVSTCFVPGRG